MFRSVVYHRSSLIGEVEIHPKNSSLGTWTREIRISYISHPPSDRCSPLAILHTISTSGVCFVMESKRSADESLLFSVYSACLRENKTAVAPVGEEELHLVAMPSRRNIPRHSCFWGYIIARGLYNSCLAMLNRRCLGIVFDLDETLLVANTMRSLEDTIDGLQRMISEMDPQRANGMLAVIKRYQEDKSILKQYVDGDQVVENGKVFKIQSEAVPPLFGSHQPLTRPIIRLHEKNIILTRVNPLIRDTSILVRLRPAWEDLRNYLIANGHKWFEVYVCTMAEKDYALEMWRLLDPECNLINSNELLDRIVSVKSGLRKSLFSVFQAGVCHPKMSLVIDDRLEVWDEKDQSRVLVVPPFAPHFGPQAESKNDILVLCAARNMACNVRGSFFKDFDEVLLPRMSEIFYEDEVEYPSVPDVGNYLISKDGTSTLNENKNPLCFDGMADAEVERRLKGANRIGQSIPPIADNIDTRAVVPPDLTVITPTAPAVSLTTTQFPNTVVPVPNPSDSVESGELWDDLPPLATEVEASESAFEKETTDLNNKLAMLVDITERERKAFIELEHKSKDREKALQDQIANIVGALEREKK
ncbi:RNA polymerase II C-terminal domain phosphatase-like 1 [Platanthera zijinensis]|uniref:protein-serine/threonine phosphatase n=1 Tax=Platanthera zijinensis TaxID=2320716 RepID=A0AAP0BNE6_9ASPA